MANASRGADAGLVVSAAGSGSTVTWSGPERRREPSARRARKVRWSRIRHNGPLIVGRSGREPLAASEAAGPEHGAPGAGRHAMPEAVALGALAGVWLVGALHLDLLVGGPTPMEGGTSRLLRARTTRRACRAGAERR